jgi:NAD(P)-dependent dehydrogenase (short-subunit alcohol dehydrogenase family)
MSATREQKTTAQAPARPAARGKVAVVTGASSGLGLETAKQLASQGAEVVMVCRDRSRGEAARSSVAEGATGRPPVLLLADLSVQAQVRHVAAEIRDRYEHVDIRASASTASSAPTGSRSSATSCSPPSWRGG